MRKRKPAETRKEAVRRQFREHAMRLVPNPAVQVFDAHGRPRRKPNYVSILAAKA
jgi:hypothetical protein